MIGNHSRNLYEEVQQAPLSLRALISRHREVGGGGAGSSVFSLVMEKTVEHIASTLLAWTIHQVNPGQETLRGSRQSGLMCLCYVSRIFFKIPLCVLIPPFLLLWAHGKIL